MEVQVQDLPGMNDDGRLDVSDHTEDALDCPGDEL